MRILIIPLLVVVGLVGCDIPEVFVKGHPTTVTTETTMLMMPMMRIK